MKIGAIMPQQETPWAEFLNVARLVDDCGYDSLWVIDHQLPAASVSMAGSQFDAWTVLAALAQATENVGLGTLVTCNGFRNPALLAKIVTTVDHISAGRVALGIGAGWFEQEHRLFGWDFPDTRERLERLEEATRIIRLVWTETRPTFRGRFYSLGFGESAMDLNGVPIPGEHAPAIGPPPIQRPHPKLIVGGSGEKLTLRIVARSADGWNVAGTPASIARKSEVLAAHCESIGRDPATIERSAYAQVIVDNSRMRIEALLARRAALRGMTVEAVREEVLAGSPAEVVDQLGSFSEVGISHFMLQIGPPYRPALIEKIASEIVVPAQGI